MAPVNGMTNQPTAHREYYHNAGSKEIGSRECQSPTIAICGIAMRLPGDINDAESLWDALYNGKDLRRKIPQSRFNLEGFNKTLGSKGATNVTHGYFLEEAVGAFDSSLFTGTKLEYSKLDPQVRKLLEVTRECLENAGEVDYVGKKVGCYVGTFGDDWLIQRSKEGSQYIGGSNATIDLYLANKVSHEFGFHGPSMVIKTGCSASLVALHEACKALQSGDCEAAIVGGTSLILNPHTYLAMATEGIFSPDGSCKPFDASANGFGRAEAINAILVKRLDDAIRDGNPVRAVIRGTGNNSNGKNKNLFAPDGPSQEALMRDTYKRAGLRPCDTAFVECHGTGTPTGDPIEANAIGNVFGAKGVTIGSVKANLGHSEGASGLTSLFKAILMLERKTILPQIKFTRPNPNICFRENNLTIQTRPTQWPNDRSHRVSINSFGIGGSNAHVIIESLECFDPTRASDPIPNGSISSHSESRLLLLSAQTSKALDQLVKNYQSYMMRHPESITDLSYTLSRRRQHLLHRNFMVVKSDREIVAATSAVRSPSQCPAIVFAFSGQGAQWPGMGLTLLQNHHQFRQDIRSMDRALQSLELPPSWTLEGELSKTGQTSQVNSAELSQPLCTAIQLALVNMLQSCEIFPVATIGHSSGEIAGAYAAGALSLEDAIVIAYYRGLVSNDPLARGAMAAIGLGSSKVAEFLGEDVTIAAENSPNSVTVSGSVEAVEKLIASVSSAYTDVLARRLKVNIAYHSPHMSSFAKEYIDKLRSTLSEFSLTPTVPIYSTVTTEVIHEPLNITYWVENLVSPVRFSGAGASIRKKMENPLLLEIGPHSQLAGPLRQIFGTDFKYVPTLVRDHNCHDSILNTIGNLYQQGIDVDLASIIPTAKLLTNLPPYPWDRSNNFWYEMRPSQSWRNRQYGHHALLGQRIPESLDAEPLWRNILDLDDEPWLADHKVQGDVIFPFAGYVSMAGEAIRQVSGNETGYSIKHIMVHSALLLRPDKPVELITHLRRRRLTDTSDSQYFDFTIATVSGLSQIKHCDGMVKSAPTSSSQSDFSQSRMSRIVMTDKWYEAMSEVGYDFGPAFRTLKNIKAAPQYPRATAEIVVNSDMAREQYTMHPSAIDGCLQLLFVSLARGMTKNLNQSLLPSLIEEIHIRKHSGPMTAQTWSARDGEYVQASSENQSVLYLRGIQFSTLEADIPKDVDRHAAGRVAWYPHFRYMDIGPLLKPPTSTIDERVFVEEMAFIGMLEYYDRIKALETTVPHLERYREWLRRELEGSRHPPALTGNTVRLAALTQPQRQLELSSRHHIMSDYPFASAMAEGILRVCARCEDIFTGHVDALQILMEGNLLTHLYNNITFDYSSFFRSLSTTQPGLRVLELGAGTGGTTAEIFSHLIKEGSPPPFEQYTFTDVSASFFIAAKERFRDVANLDYAVYDVSRDPLGQGFSPAAYDIILAANVIHTVPSLSKSLTYIRQLLRPGGYLLMTEAVTESRVPSFIFGNFSGWWMGDNDDRYWEPYVSIERWNQELISSGFGGVKTSVLDCEEPYHWSAAILTEVPFDQEARPQILILSQDIEGSIATSLSIACHRRGYNASVQCFGYRPTRESTIIIVTVDLETNFFEDISAEDFATFQDFCRHCQGHQCTWVLPPCHVATSDPRSSQSLGALQVARAELDLSLHTVEVSNEDQNCMTQILNVVDLVQRPNYSDRIMKDTHYIVKDGILKIGRIENFSLSEEVKVLNRPMEQEITQVMDVKTPGMLSTLHWREESLGTMGNYDVTIEIKAVGINFRDVVEATGLLGKKSTPLGFESSGVIRAVGPLIDDLQVGDRVIALQYRSLATLNIAPGHLCVKVPDSMSFEEAASLPIAFATALYSLENIARLSSDHTVLIHSACGGVGHAAVQVCQHIGAKIFVTVGSSAKADYMNTTFGIPRNRIFNSRDDSFLSDLMRETKGTGVDIVLNSLSGNLLHASWRCVAEFGTMIELGKRDLIGHGHLDMEPFLSSRTYTCVDVAHFLIKKPSAGRRLLQRTITLVVENKWRMPRVDFTARDAENAFRHLQDGTHIGKAVVYIDKVPQVQPRYCLAASIQFDKDASYILTGGLGGLGKSILVWMAERGAQSFVVLSRTAGKSSADQAFIKEMEDLGCSVIAISGKAECLEDIERAVHTAPSRIKGVFHFAMVQREGPLLDLSYDDWKSVVSPKVDGAWNLHNSLVKNMQTPDFFILASSLLALLNQPHESNYSAASTFLESFGVYRRGLGLPACTLAICPISDVGFVADRPTTRRSLQQQGLYFLGENEFLNFVEFAILNQSNGSQASMKCPHDVSVDTSFVGMGIRSHRPLSDQHNRLHCRNDPKMGYLHNVRLDLNTSGTEKSSSNNLAVFLGNVRHDPELLSNTDNVKFIAKEILQQLLNIMMQEDRDVDITASPQQLGVDSLLSIELRRWWKLTFGVNISVLEILACHSVEELGFLTASKLREKVDG